LVELPSKTFELAFELAREWGEDVVVAVRHVYM
jgi:hypothetical protein